MCSSLHVEHLFVADCVSDDLEPCKKIFQRSLNQIGMFDIYDLIDGTPFVVRYARCDSDDEDNDDDDHACFKHSPSFKLQSNLKWLHNITMVTRTRSVQLPSTVQPDGYGCIKVRGATYDARGRIIAQAYGNARRLAARQGKLVCLLVHTSNWEVMCNATSLSHTKIFAAMWRASDMVSSGPQDRWIAKKRDKFLGYLSFRDPILRNPRENEQRRKLAETACLRILGNTDQTTPLRKGVSSENSVTTA